VVNPKLHVAALEAACPARAQSLLTAVLDEVPDAEGFIASFGAVMLVHVGPGLVGLAWWWET
jgi:fatty acid-binding protein DegV